MDQEKIEEFRKKRLAEAEKKQADADAKKQADSLNETIRNGAKLTAKTVLASNQKTAEQLSSELRQSGENILNSLQESQGSIASALNNLVLATVVSKDPQVMEVAKGLTDLFSSIADASKDFKGSKINLLPEANKKLSEAVDKLTAATKAVEKKPTKDYTKDLEAVVKAVQALDFNVNVASPDVVVPPVDFSPILEALKNEPEEVDDYRAHDIDEEDISQYIGMVASDGKWMIIYNDMEGNSLRYKMGLSGYEKAWPNKSNFQYLTYDEATNEIRS